MRHGAHSKIFRRISQGHYPDKRTHLGREMVNLRECLIRDMGGDPSQGQRILIDRVVMKTFQCQAVELALSEGDKTPMQFYLSLTNSLRLDLVALGLERRAKGIGSLKDYLEVRR